MHFSDSSYKITQVQQKQDYNIKTQKLIVYLWEYKHIKNFRYSKLICSIAN